MAKAELLTARKRHEWACGQVSTVALQDALTWVDDLQMELQAGGTPVPQGSAASDLDLPPDWDTGEALTRMLARHVVPGALADHGYTRPKAQVLSPHG